MTYISAETLTTWLVDDIIRDQYFTGIDPVIVIQTYLLKFYDNTVRVHIQLSMNGTLETWFSVMLEIHVIYHRFHNYWVNINIILFHAIENNLPTIGDPFIEISAPLDVISNISAPTFIELCAVILTIQSLSVFLWRL